MLALLFIRVVWSIWFIGSLYLLGSSLSILAFKQDGKGFQTFGKNLLVAALWPFMALSPAGRSRITKTLKGTI
jgi:hypothetical protein